MQKNKGFTIFELVIVMLILAIMSVSVFISIGFLRGIKLTSAAEKLAADIRFTQSQALSKVLWEGISFEVTPTNKYYVYQTNGTISTPETDPADFRNSLIINLNDKFGVTINSVTFQGGGTRVVFNGLGKPYSDYNGTLFTSDGTIVLGLGTLTRTITITKNTGKVTIQ